MRNLFIVLAKVVGLLQIARCLVYVEAIIRHIYHVCRMSMFTNPIEGYENMLDVYLTTCLYLGFAWVLLYRTSWIADQLRFSEDETLLPEPSPLLYMGVKLLGLFILVDTLPNFIYTVINTRGLSPDSVITFFWTRILSILLKLVFGLFLVMKTKTVQTQVSAGSKEFESRRM
jgi:hypothetical protein